MCQQPNVYSSMLPPINRYHKSSQLKSCQNRVWLVHTFLDLKDCSLRYLEIYYQLWEQRYRQLHYSSDSTVGFFILFLYHSAETSIAAVLVIVAVGLSLMQIGSVNVVLTSTPKQQAKNSRKSSPLNRTCISFIISQFI